MNAVIFSAENGFSIKLFQQNFERCLIKRAFDCYVSGFNTERSYLIIEDLNLNKKAHYLLKSAIEMKGWFSQEKGRFISFKEFSFGGTFSYYSEEYKEFIKGLSENKWGKSCYLKMPDLILQEMNTVFNGYISNVIRKT